MNLIATGLSTESGGKFSNWLVMILLHVMKCDTCRRDIFLSNSNTSDATDLKVSYVKVNQSTSDIAS